MDNDSKWCFAWPVAEQSTSGADRAALVKASKWPKNEVITVSFLDGDPAVQKKVREVAMGWTAPGLANLKIVFKKTKNTLIRISFKHSGSWSTLGTTCKQVTNKSEPTMNYGWLTANSTDEEIQRVVLHEFGHALGLIHEHQNPSGGIKWNKPAVIRELSSRWTLEQIEHNLFEPYSKEETNYTDFDPASIMLYPIPASWTTDGFSTTLNTKLSDKDKEFIHKEYP